MRGGRGGERDREERRQAKPLIERQKTKKTHVFLVPPSLKKKTGRLAPRPPLRHGPRPAGPRRPGVRHARLHKRVLHGQGHPRRERGDVVLRGRADSARRRRRCCHAADVSSNFFFLLLPRRRARRLGHEGRGAPGPSGLRQARVRVPGSGGLQSARRAAGALL